VMTKSKDALHKAHQKRTAREEEYKKSVNWCKREKKGAKACMTQNKQWQNISLPALQRRLSRKEVHNAPQNANMILAPLEEKELAQWINDCALSRAGKYREEIADKVREIVKARHKANKRRWPSSCTPLYCCYKNFDGRWGDQRLVCSLFC